MTNDIITTAYILTIVLFILKLVGVIDTWIVVAVPVLSLLVMRLIYVKILSE